MDVLDVFLQIGLVTGVLVTYLILFRNKPQRKGNYVLPGGLCTRHGGWNYYLKVPCAYFFIKKWKKNRSMTAIDEMPRNGLLENKDELSLRASSPDGTIVVLGIRKLGGRQPLAEVTVFVKLPDGTELVLPRNPDTAIGAWLDYADGWRAGGLTIQILEPYKRLRIIFDEELKRVSDGVRVHVKFNLIWTAVTRVFHHPADSSNWLFARALALEPWHGTKWHDALKICTSESDHQYGAAQGRLQVFGDSGIEQDLYIRTRGVRERRLIKNTPRRSMTLTVAASDGTLIELQGYSYSESMTKFIFGSIRLPNYSTWPITWTDLNLSDFCETPAAIPKVYTINISTSERQFKVVIRINNDGTKLFSGVPYQEQSVLRTVHVTIDEYSGTGALFLNYKAKEVLSPSVYLRPKPLLRWLDEDEVGPFSYCAEFESPAAKCPNIVGGKGASLALLASMQLEEGYHVPPGFCVTYLALDKHLEANPEIIDAIKVLQAATVDYEENDFKSKCEKVVELFSKTEIAGEMKNEIVIHLESLEKTAQTKNYGKEIVYAVRSSAVGEDSEALSAAGQNSTILGCRKDNVVNAVRDCWASMYSFHSVFYRRRNGQQALCRGSVTVQTLVAADTAGVLFTRHEKPGRITIAANHGLGESVVSGAAEPDSIIVRNINNELKIERIDIGAKAQRVVTSEDGVQTVSVLEADRNKPCLSEGQITRLARLGVIQEELWGAHRDIEWAFAGNNIYLLQARPITSLDRWTEEELLHELDAPIMSDDELITFANTGEVLPKPNTALNCDMVIDPLGSAMVRLMHHPKNYDDAGSVFLTHFRGVLSLYLSVYRVVPEKIDVGLRMMEMAIHGNPVAGDKILDVAKHRNKPKRIDRILSQLSVVKFAFVSSRYTKKSIQCVKTNEIKVSGVDLSDDFDNIVDSSEFFKDVVYYHAVTTTASVASQILAMIIFLEGQSDFSAEKCSEISSILSSGDVISAEVPQGLANICLKIKASNKYEEFKKQESTKAMDWLQEHLPNVRQDVDAFLEAHGHRAIMEFDVATKPWVLVPENLMSVLQSIEVNADQDQKRKTMGDVVSSLKTPKKNFTKKALMWVLPFCHRMVRNRETTKSQLIMSIHKLRLALRKLAVDMVKQWYLPDPELIFHFRRDELRMYLKTRDPALLRKATQRSQYYSSWSKLKYEEMHEGWPTPEPQKTIKYNPDACVRGTGVCGDDVVARAAVLTDLGDIGVLRQGDILITRSTDIGWSPYFPLISGVVTELGGLISHGAVIAREYGLPCVVGATGATDVFTTGDTIRISPSRGTIERVTLKPETKDQSSSK